MTAVIGATGAVELAAVRRAIDEVDARLLELVAERARLAVAAGRTKAALGLPVVDDAQEVAVFERADARARALGLDPARARAAFEALIALARAAQHPHDGDVDRR